jgi:hypothetical protein
VTAGPFQGPLLHTHKRAISLSHTHTFFTPSSLFPSIPSCYLSSFFFTLPVGYFLGLLPPANQPTNQPFLRSRRIAGNRKQIFVYYNEGCAYTKGCVVSAEGLDMLALVDLLLVGDDPN